MPGCPRDEINEMVTLAIPFILTENRINRHENSANITLRICPTTNPRAEQAHTKLNIEVA